MGKITGSRQTLVTGEACRRACEKLMEDRRAGKELKDMKGIVYYGEYLAKTDPLGANVPNPVSHVAYGYATQMCVVDPKTGKLDQIVAAHDVGKAVNPLSCEGQIEGGVVMSMGYALREQYPIDENCKPIQKYGSLRLFRSHEVPKIKETFTQKLKKDYSIEGLKSDSQEYHESGFIERYPVDVKKIKKTEPKLFEQDKVSSQNMEYLQKLISFCKENDIEFVAVTTPVPIAALKDYSDNYNAAWKYFGKFFEEQDVEYLNFNTQYFKVFTHDMKAYTDYDGHMNGDAARQYSRILAELLDKK